MTQRSLEQAEAKRRIIDFRDEYLLATGTSIDRAERFKKARDPFTAYMYLFAAFNNLYAAVSRWDRQRSESERIRMAVCALETSIVESFYSAEYIDTLRWLNEREPDLLSGKGLGGILDMGMYLRGIDVNRCVKSVSYVATTQDAGWQKRTTVAEIAAELLYTVRNNQFHAIKRAGGVADENTLRYSYKALKPVVDSLLPLVEEDFRSLTI